MARGGTRLRATRAQPASTSRARPPVTALTRHAVTCVVDNASGETTSQPPSASSALTAQDPAGAVASLRFIALTSPLP
jgi:hypothetical protein